MSKPRIKTIRATEILSAGSYPTIEVEVELSDRTKARASVPRGTSAGTFEPWFFLDGDEGRYHGRGMLKAKDIINNKISGRLSGTYVEKQADIDAELKNMSFTRNKENDLPKETPKYYVNLVLPISLACARAAGKAEGVPLYEYLMTMMGKKKIDKLPKPMAVVVEGGAHAAYSTDYQEYLVLGQNDDRRKAVRNCVEVYQALKEILEKEGYSTNVGYEGAYAFTKISGTARSKKPAKHSLNERPLYLIEKAIRKCKLKLGEDISLALDVAASEFQKEDKKKKKKLRKDEYKLKGKRNVLKALDLISDYEKLLVNHPGIISIEDGLGEEDWRYWPVLCKRLSKLKENLLIVGDDITVTNTKLVKKAIAKKAINALLVKPNQAGTLTDTINAIREVKNAGMEIVVSHRGGGETNDDFIVDLAVAAEAAYIKCGVSRGERVSKYNRLMEIASEL